MAKHIVAEEWRPVVGWEGSYEVSNCARIRAIFDGSRYVGPRIIKTCVTRSGYERVIFCRHGVKRYRFVHAVMLETFVGPRPSGYHACHGDGNPLNNQLDNLRWDTPLGNSRDTARHGRTAAGDRNGRRKLSSWDVRIIRRLIACGVFQGVVAERFGVTRSNIYHIATRRTWRMV